MTQRAQSTHIRIYQKCFAFWLFLSLALAAFGAGRGECQEIMLDKVVKCGDLICFPTYDDNSTYYYLPDHPRVAKKNGRPQFSFLKYARIKESGKAGINRAEGGGILHFLVEYGVTPGRIAKAEAALKQKDKKAKIAGPVMYRKANFALVTTFNKENREFTKIATIGKAPVLEGQKAAVSIGLTREGAEVLWESFKTSTPDISIVIEAEYDGIQNPYDATLTVDWSKVSMNHHIQAGGTYKWFGADVDILLKELRQQGAVTVVVKGKDQDMDAVWKAAEEFLRKKMFREEPIDKTLCKEVTKGKFPSLQKALSLSRRSAALEQDLPLHATIHLNRYPEIMAALRALAAEILGIPEASAYTFKDVHGPGVLHLRRQEYEECAALLNEVRKGGYKYSDCKKALDCYKSIRKEGELSDVNEKNIKKAIRLLKKKLHAAKPAAGSPQDESQSIADAALQAALSVATPSGEEETGKPASISSGPKAKHHTHRTRHAGAVHKPHHRRHKPGHGKRGGKRKHGRGAGVKSSHPTSGPIGLMVSYRLRRIKRSGKYVLNMKRYTTASRHTVMSENIGDLYSRYGNDPKVFRAVLIDDPVYKQREILITLDGQDAETFRKHVNFVTVQMRKVHESGEITRDEIAITPDNFNSKANLYEFVYGYKGDTDRDAWLNYEARDIWSFGGGITVEHPWTKHSEAILAVASPVRYRTISIEADGNRLAKAGVRHGVIELYSTINGKELKEEVSIRNSGPAPMKMVDIPVEGEEAPEYSITWYLNDGSRIQGERQRLKGDILYWDTVGGVER